MDWRSAGIPILNSDRLSGTNGETTAKESRTRLFLVAPAVTELSEIVGLLGDEP